ncbi:hypothetical protein ACFL06_00055 [Patescibacteria group bacterium]
MKNIYIVGGAFTLINLLFIGFIVFPLIQNIKKVSDDLTLQKADLLSIEQKKGNVDNLKKLSATYQEESKEIDSVFVDPDIPTDFNRFLENTAFSSEAEIDISAKEGVQENSLSYQISLTSSFPQFLGFVEKLENGPYPIEILNANLKKATKGEVSVTLVLLVLTQ